MHFELVYSPNSNIVSKVNEVCSGSKGNKRTCITDFDRKIGMIEYKGITKEVQFLIVYFQ
jgi:hypothetical protein